VRQLVDAAGQVTLAQSYDPFGDLISQSTNFPVSQPFGYTGEQVDGSTDLLFLRARYYDPATGRFLSKDPNPGNVYQPQSLNPYVYVLNNATNDRDPTGEQAENLANEFLMGVVYQFIDNNYSALGIPEQSRSLLRRGADEVAAKYGDSVAFQLGRLTGSVITIGQAFMEVEGGVSIMGCGAVGGLVTAESGIGAATGVGVVVVGAAVTAHGVVVGVVSAANAGDIAGNIYWITAKGSGGGGRGGKGGGEGNIPPRGRIDPNKVRFSQDSISYRFRDGSTIDDLAEGLRTGRVRSEDVPPIRIVERDGKLFTLDNRRLEAFRRAGVDIPYQMANPNEIAAESWKFTTQNKGISIRVRGQP
jgi:RHS repeat-associated protein